MRLLRSLVSIAILAVTVTSFAQDAQASTPVAIPAPANHVLTLAEGQAKDQGKNVLVIFHASWCGWCKRLDEFMNNPQFKPVFDENIVVAKLTVLEDDKHKLLENSGGLEEMDVLGGRDAGLPLFAILDPTGKTIVTSMMSVDGQAKPENTGFPAKPEEINHFLSMMQKGAPKVTADQLKDMQAYLTAKAAAPSGGGILFDFFIAEMPNARLVTLSPNRAFGIPAIKQLESRR